MSRCDRCGGKDHATMGHDAWAADVLASQRSESYAAAGIGDEPHGPDLLRTEIRDSFREKFGPAADEAATMIRAGQRMSSSLDFEALLTFEPESQYSDYVLTGRPQKPFLPRGLMLWGVAGMNLRAALVSVHDTINIGCGLVPAEWFATSQSFEQVLKAHAEGNGPGRGWGHWPTVHPGQMVRLLFDRPLSGSVRALMWGHTA